MSLYSTNHFFTLNLYTSTFAIIHNMKNILTLHCTQCDIKKLNKIVYCKKKVLFFSLCVQNLFSLFFISILFRSRYISGSAIFSFGKESETEVGKKNSEKKRRMTSASEVKLYQNNAIKSH